MHDCASMPRSTLSRGDIEGVEEVGVHPLMFEEG
jgi:hypothetical protein